MKKYFVIISLLITSLCFAHSHSGDTPPISLQGGQILPNHYFKLDLQPLYHSNYSAYYSVTCDIFNPNYNKQYPVILSMSGPIITLNGKSLAPGGQAKLDQPINKYVANNVYTGRDSLSFINYDDSDTVTVENCVGTLMTSSNR